MGCDYNGFNPSSNPEEFGIIKLAHEHYCSKCKRTYECNRRGCKLVVIRMCISCKVIEESENELED